MNAQLRLDIARELLRLASPAQRGLRRMVLNTRTGRRTYWVQVPKPKPRAIERPRAIEKPKTAKELGLSMDELSMPPEFRLEGRTQKGTSVIAMCKNVPSLNASEISFMVNDSFNAGTVDGADAISTTKLMKRLMKQGIASHPKGSVYFCVPFDENKEKRNKKEKFYQQNGFGESHNGALYAIKGEDNIHPVDRDYMMEIEDLRYSGDDQYSDENYQPSEEHWWIARQRQNSPAIDRGIPDPSEFIWG